MCSGERAWFPAPVADIVLFYKENLKVRSSRFLGDINIAMSDDIAEQCFPLRVPVTFERESQVVGSASSLCFIFGTKARFRGAAE